MRPNIVWFDHVSSTQDVARRFVDKKKEIVIAANEQTRGRGRQGRQWFSPPGGLWMSLLLFPKVKDNLLHYITLIGSVAVVNLLDYCNLTKIGIHWPNDIIVRDKKISGILAERYRDSIICGIGININQDELPVGLGPATSLKIETKKTFEVPLLLKKLIDNFYAYYRDFQRNEIKGLILEYKKYLMLTNEVVELDIGSKTITGLVCDVDEEGRIIFRETSGIIRHLSVGRVRRALWY